MTKEKMQKAQELNSKISSLDDKIKTLGKIENSAVQAIKICICEEYGESRLTFLKLKDEIEVGVVLHSLLEMCREKRDKLKDEFLAL